MHIPDGFINAGTSLGVGVVTAGGLGVCLRRAREALADRLEPLAGLTAAFVFALQLLNFPVAAGTSGHLIGGVLAAVLVGPWAAALCLAVVLAVQALFADGGLTALGLNIFNMGIVAGMGGYLIFRALRAVLPATRGAVVGATAVAAGMSVPLSALAFVAQYAVGGHGDAATATVLGAMVGVHLLIGVGEGVITGMVVGAVLASRPDLVYGAADLVPRPELGGPLAAPAGVRQ